MPVSIVVGGQFGSEGKGKVALEIVRGSKVPAAAVRVGGANSGHTAYDRSCKRWALRQLPAACVDLNVDVIFPAGSYIDVKVLLQELKELRFPLDRLYINEHASVVTEAHQRWEMDAGLTGTIGSTGSGVGAAVMALAARAAKTFPLHATFAHEVPALQPYLADTSSLLSRKLRAGERVVVEGSQGFGLSLLDGGYWPKATARSTTAAAALAEAGLSPLWVDDVTLVLRTFPIRVSGDSGPLYGETSWEEIARAAGRVDDLREFTTVTKKLRRVGCFDIDLVKRAVAANAPTRLVLNHVDYLRRGEQAAFIEALEANVGQSVEWFGFSGTSVVARADVRL